MPVPATTGQLRSNIRDMEIGDYIYGSYTSASSYFIGSNQGTTETNLTGKTGDITGFWYFIKVNKGLLISDRVVWHSTSWDAINAAKLIEGRPLATSDETVGVLRSLTGGALYADANGNKSNTDLRFGVFPTINEWDKYLINFPANKILSGKKLDDVFHYLDNYTWCKETPIYGTWKDSAGNTSTSASSTQRIGRGSNTRAQWGDINYELSSGSYATWGFRPVFEYREV